MTRTTRRATQPLSKPDIVSGRLTDLPPHFGQATPYNSLVLLILEDRKTRGVSAYILCKLLAWGKGVPNASRIAF